jgi:hypothetical protein
MKQQSIKNLIITINPIAAQIPEKPACLSINGIK